MAPIQSRQLLVWSLPTLAVLLSYFWFKKKRLGHQSDIRDTNRNQVIKVVECDNLKRETSANRDIPQSNRTIDSTSPKKPFSRSLSGVDSAPIDIIIPPDMRAAKSNQVVISDEDLDAEIEKIKSMRSSLTRSSSKLSPQKPVTPPIEETPTEVAELFEQTVEEIQPEAACKKPVEIVPAAKEVTVVDSCQSTSSPEEETVEKITKTENSVEYNSTHLSENTKTSANTKTSEDSNKLPENTKLPEHTSASHNYKKNTQVKPPVAKAKRVPNKMKDTNKSELRAVQKEMEEKFQTMRITNKKVNSKKPRNTKPRMFEKEKMSQNQNKNSERKEEPQRRSCDRDSANHSPADIMMASPSLSNISDNGSSDSGKGGSDVATPPSSHTNTYLRCEQLVVHEFDVPRDIVGRLIGKKGCFVTQIKIKTNADIVVKSYPPPYVDHKVCVVEGTPSEIEAALKMIRKKFPIETNPKLTLQPWNTSPVQILPDALYLRLVEGINNDTIICCVESPVNLFVQFPTHPSFMNLSVLQNCMNLCYSTESPELPNPAPVGAVCVAQTKDGWFRAQIVSSEDEEHTYIKFLDYGGYELVNAKDLRKIRCDFTYLPFQATECILANIQPVEDEEKVDEAIEYVKEISRTGLVFTQVTDYTSEGIPLVVCFVNDGNNQLKNLNVDLTEKGYAHYILPVDGVQQQETEATASTAAVEPVASAVELEA